LRSGFTGLDEIAVLANDVGDERSMQQGRDRAGRNEERDNTRPKPAPSASEGRDGVVGSAMSGAIHGCLASAGSGTEVKRLAKSRPCIEARGHRQGVPAERDDPIADRLKLVDRVLAAPYRERYRLRIVSADERSRFLGRYRHPMAALQWLWRKH
jgi:hypothetical protein